MDVSIMERMSEKVEIRVTVLEKEALIAEAKASGHSLSELVRNLIWGNWGTQSRWLLTSNHIKMPSKSVSGVLLALLTLCFSLLLPAASAQSFKVQLNGSISCPANSADARRSISTTLVTAEGEPFFLQLSPPEQAMGIEPANMLGTVFKAEPAISNPERHQYRLEMSLLDCLDSDFQPTITMLENEMASIEVGTVDDPSSILYISAVLTVLPED
ncbi:hypothetical protein NHF45_04980 [Maricaulaceae bacterium NA33B04]|nr:hypothetical protein [Maricaulaceae bacterium NA33B04]